jgi:hypothetical protein
MSTPDQTHVERGASEEAADSPLTPTEVASSQRPPSEPGNPPSEDDESARTPGDHG